MELINATKMTAGYTLGLERSCRESLIVAIKGTFSIPKDGERLALADEQLPLVLADEFEGEPGRSAPAREADFALRKARCDVLLRGSAYAPSGRPAVRVPVGLSVGAWRKTFAVVGDRVWARTFGGVTAGPPAPFVRKSISYCDAYGGVDDHDPDPSRHVWFMRNPVGRGFRTRSHAGLDGIAMPSCEEIGRPVEVPGENYVPMSFGPVGRYWSPRVGYAGTYDEKWQASRFPFLPVDFDEQYYQAAPSDQQIAYPADRLRVRMVNLTPDGIRDFELPKFEAPVHFFRRDGGVETQVAVLDTIVFEPDREMMSLVWRAARPLRRSAFEIAEILVGKPDRQWWIRRDEVEEPISEGTAEPVDESSHARPG